MEKSNNRPKFGISVLKVRVMYFNKALLLTARGPRSSQFAEGFVGWNVTASFKGLINF